jgi:hypothetical protein
MRLVDGDYPAKRRRLADTSLATCNTDRLRSASNIHHERNFNQQQIATPTSSEARLNLVHDPLSVAAHEQPVISSALPDQLSYAAKKTALGLSGIPLDKNVAREGLEVFQSAQGSQFENSRPHKSENGTTGSGLAQELGSDDCAEICFGMVLSLLCQGYAS